MKRCSTLAELGEVEVVVEHLTGVIKDGAGGVSHDLLKGQVFEAAAGKELIEVIHVGLQVLTVVEAEGVGADDGFEGVGRVWEGEEFIHYLYI